MKITFHYNLEKDVENFLKGTQSKNNTNYTDFTNKYVSQYGEKFEKETVKKFIQAHLQEQETNLDQEVWEFERRWREIEREYISRTEKVFGVHAPVEKIKVYLSTNSRCTYNVEGGYFFVSLGHPDASNWIIMHELFHFYTYWRFKEELTKKGVNDKQYNDIKESLTQILNLGYKDLMGERIDKGYPQHHELREEVTKVWEEIKDIDGVVNHLALKVGT